MLNVVSPCFLRSLRKDIEQYGLFTGMVYIIFIFNSVSLRGHFLYRNPLCIPTAFYAEAACDCAGFMMAV